MDNKNNTKKEIFKLMQLANQTFNEIEIIIFI